MLKYFVETTEALLIAGILIGMMTGYARSAYGKKGRLPADIGVWLGVIGAVVMAYLKNATRLIDTSLWNLRIFLTCIGALLLFWICAAAAHKEKKVMPVLAGSFLGVISAGLLIHAVPDVISNPYIILMTEKSVLSTAFMLKTIGIIFGILLTVLLGLAIESAMLRLRRGQAMLLLSLALGFCGLRLAANCIRIMQTKRIITPDMSIYHFCFRIIKFTSNHDKIFIFAILAAAACVPVLLLLRSFHITEPYKNNAERRKLLKKLKVNRRWAAAAVLCMLLSLVNISWFKAIVTRAVDLAPIEECKISGHDMVVPFEQVEDGHLHRFAYTTEDNVQIRFIIIKKPNSSSYGIGLDACDICGETGYYEKDGQVVCKLCDVVMNINTIGFKGGCNPIVIPYTIENGSIVVPVDGLLDHKKEFQ